MGNDLCPECGSDSYDTIKHSWREGVTPYPTYYVCCSCGHEWDDEETEKEEEHERLT
jgi:DNA-directed RNA polymerase subunit M/transcription elongation factor TFIIS